jgi:hypothetical protein
VSISLEEDVTTLLTGPVIDQASLHGLPSVNSVETSREYLSDVKREKSDLIYIK